PRLCLRLRPGLRFRLGLLFGLRLWGGLRRLLPRGLRGLRRLRALRLRLLLLRLLGRLLRFWLLVRLGLAAAAAARSDASDRRADLRRYTLLDEDLELAVLLRLEVECGLVRLDLGQHLALVDLVAAGLLPLDDLALLHRVGELRHVHVRHGLRLDLPAHGPADQSLDVLRGRDGRLLEREAVRHRHLPAAGPQDRRIEVVEAPLL